MTKNYSIYQEILIETKSRSYLGIAINLLFSLLLLLTVEHLFGAKPEIFGLIYLIFLVSFIRCFHLVCFDRLSLKAWHLWFTILVLVSGALWSGVIYKALSLFHSDLKVITLVNMIFYGIVANASYSLALSKRDYYFFGAPILLAPFLFFICQEQSDLNSGFLFATLFLFFVLISMVRRDYAKQWLNVLKQKNELRLIVNSFPGGVSLIKKNKYVYVNDWMSMYSGIDPSKFVNQDVGFANKESAFASAYRIFELSKEQSTTQEVFISVNGVTKLCLLIFKRMDDDDSGVIAITLDIHTQRHNEMALQSAAKMAALGEMSSSLAHEINNPLAVISAQVSQLSKVLDSSQLATLDKGKFEVGLQRIYRTVFRISEIIKGLRQIARNDNSDPKELAKIQDIIKETVSLCETKCRNYGIQIKIDEPPEAIMIRCHPAQISQVVLNLLNNSIYAVQTLAEKWIQIVVSVSDGKLTLSFVDSGGGIDKSLVDKIMTPFFTTKPTGKGTGLGLSISRSIIEQHKGHFSYDEKAKNTTFEVILPIAIEK